jgi:hypothetical protein
VPPGDLEGLKRVLVLCNLKVKLRSKELGWSASYYVH